LRLARQVAQQRAAMAREALEVEHLLALLLQLLQQPRLAAVGGAADDAVVEALRQRRERLAHPGAIALPAAGDDVDVEADEPQVGGPQRAALAAAKAVDEEAILGPVARDQRRRVRGQVAERVLGADQVGGVRVGLVLDADLGELGVVDHRQVDRAGDVILQVLVRRARVDDQCVLPERQRGQRRGVDRLEFVSGIHAGHCAFNAPGR
jgi:hypothetical protein